MRFIYLLLLGLLVNPIFADTVQTQPQGKLSATLQHVEAKPLLSRSVPLRLTVENTGEASLALVRLRSRKLERHSGWGAWNIHIDGPDGKWYFVAIPIIVGPLSDNDIIDLLPGESFGLLIDVGSAATHKLLPTGKYVSRSLFETKGEYKVTVSYSPSKQHFSHVKRDDLSLQTVQSNAVKLTIGR